MPRITIVNDRAEFRCLLVEPWGTDHWLRSGEAFTVVAAGEPVEEPFTVAMHGEGISVSVNVGVDPPTVLAASGDPVPCGYQRPPGWGSRNR